MSHRFNRSRAVWQFTTARFRVALYLERDANYTYDGDDPDGETQEKLDSGEFVAFNSDVIVYLDGNEIARDSLSGSVYDSDRVAEFYTDHRGPDPLNRNCSVRGDNVCIGHYFPDMVREAISQARDYVEQMPVPPRMRGDV